MLEIECTQAVATVRMVHGKVNAMSQEFVEKLNATFEELKADDQVKQVIIAGNEKIFSAGVDLKRLANEGAEYLDRFLPELTRLFLDVFNFPKPLIAAITGPAVAGGCVLACAADYRVIAERAIIGVPELRVGVPFPSAGMEIMRWATTRPAFRAIINTGATFRGEDAVAVGLADEISKRSDILEAAGNAIEPFRVVPTEVFKLTKRQMRLPVLDRIRRSEEEFGNEINRYWRHPETRAAVTRYVNERLS